MKKLLLGSLFGVATLAGPAGAQFYGAPVTNPLQAPLFNPIQPYYYYGNPGARPFAPGYATPGFGGGLVGPGFQGQGVGLAVGATPDLSDPTVTGHATRFFDYSRYFFNQGGTVTGPANQANVLGTAPSNPRPAPSIGAAPPRGRANTK
jgi:hypothetical protein